jgi:hypothetical protein
MKNRNYHVLTITILVSLWFTGCLGLGKSENTAVNNAGGTPSMDPGISANPIDRPLLPAGVVRYDSMLTNFETKLGVTKSAQTSSVFTNNVSSLPVNGTLSEINAGMWMAVVAIAGNVCNDLLNQESSRASAQRKFFQEINFTGTNDLSVIRDGLPLRELILRRITLAAWGRPADSDERAHFQTALASPAFTNLSSLPAADTRAALLVMCTGALASYQSIKS